MCMGGIKHMGYPPFHRRGSRSRLATPPPLPKPPSENPGRANTGALSNEKSYTHSTRASLNFVILFFIASHRLWGLRDKMEE